MNELNDFLKILAAGKKEKAEKVAEATQQLGDFLGIVAEAKAQDPKHQMMKEVKKNLKHDIGNLFEQLQQSVPVHEEKIDRLVESVQLVNEIESNVVGEFIIEDGRFLDPVTLTEVAVPEIKPAAEMYTKAEIDDLLKHNASFQQPDPKIVDANINAVQQKLKFLEQAIGKIAATGPGSGEVNFRWLDDVNRSTMTESNDNWVLEYDVATKKVQFTKEIGPIDSVRFDVNHVDDGDQVPGTLSWNFQDMTLNLHHPQGSRQQIGMEQYYPPVRNLTGSDIPDGTVVMFAGAEEDNNSRLLISPMIADGTYPSLYTMGVVTAAIADGEVGFVTVFGYVNDIDTSMWNKGDILYADPAVPGGMTNVKPTSPNNCVVIAAVVRKDATAGRIMVRPTIEQKMLYGRFASSVDQSPAAINTPYALDFNISEVERGFHRDGGGLPTSAITTEESGYYSISAILSLTSTNSSSKAFYVWLRKNGVDVPLSTRRQSVSGNGTYQSFVYRTTLSLNKGDYFQIMYAASDTTIQINSPPATAFCPAVPAATLLVTQVAL